MKVVGSVSIVFHRKILDQIRVENVVHFGMDTIVSILLVLSIRNSLGVVDNRAVKVVFLIKGILRNINV